MPDASPQTSLLVTDPHEANVLESPRMTLVGDVQRFDASPELQARYVRYQCRERIPFSEAFASADILTETKRLPA